MSSHINAEIVISEDFDCLQKIGTPIGSGTQSVVFQPHELFQTKKFQDDQVLIVTKELEKFDLLRVLFEDTCAKVTKIKDKDLSSEAQDIVYEMEPFGWNFFYVTKLEPSTLTELNLACQVIEEISKRHWSTRYTPKSLPVTDILEEIGLLYYEYSTSDDIDMEPSDIDKDVIGSVEKALISLKSSSIEDSFTLDLHNEQFAVLNNELLCIDPVLFTML